MYTVSPYGWPDPIVLHCLGWNCVGDSALANGATCNSVTWPTASTALFYPFVITEARTYLLALWANGPTVSGNVDVGVYDLSGSRKESLGSTAQAGISVTQIVTLGTSIVLAPGRYFMAMVMDNAVGTVMRGNIQAPSDRAAGAQQMAAAFPLPATATFVAMTAAIAPAFGFSEVNWL